jgi:hypothetical protein
MLHRLKRMDAAMERFLGSSEEGNEVVSEMSDLSLKSKLPVLEIGASYKTYLDKKQLLRVHRDTYERLDLIWKQTFLFTEIFGVSATAGPAEIKIDLGPPSDIDSHVDDDHEDTERISFEVSLKCSLFTVDVKFVHTEIIRYDDRKMRSIEYTISNMKSERPDVWRHVPKLRATKMLYNSMNGVLDPNPYNRDLEDKDAYFLAFDLLSNLQAVLRHNQLIDRMKVLYPILKHGHLPDTAIDKIRELWIQDAKNNVMHHLRGMLEMCRPGFTPAMDLNDVLESTLTAEEGEVEGHHDGQNGAWA